MYKRIFIILLFLITVCYFVVSNKVDDNELKEIRGIEYNIDYFNNNILYNIDKYNNYFSDRYVDIKNKQIYIGKSKNEIDNGYYDLNMKVNDKYVEVYINKLFKEDNVNIIFDENYVSEIVEYIINIFDFKIDKNEIASLIIENYENLRDIDRNNVDSVDKSVEINDIKIHISTKDNMLVLNLGDK